MNRLQIIIFIFLIIFKKSGYNKLKDIEGSKDTINNKLQLHNEFLALIITYIVIFIELVCTFIIVYYFNSKKINHKTYVTYSLYSLIAFMTLVILYYHNPLTMDNQTTDFLMRLSIICGLLFISYIHLKL
jgi:uncharacterized membrane protein YphA (DoxX/SURF4 family)